MKGREAELLDSCSLIGNYMVVVLNVQHATNLFWWMRIDQLPNVVVKKRKRARKTRGTKSS